MNAVHRADYEARDLLDAANWILAGSLANPIQQLAEVRQQAATEAGPPGN